MGAAQYVEIAGYAALILRNSYPELAQPGALIDRSKEWWSNTAARWVEAEHTWRFPSGASIKFGYLENENDKYNFKSSEFQYIAFDELTQFTYSMYDYLKTRLRRKMSLPVPLRMRAASNPGQMGHEWVRDYFVDPGNPLRPFVPASLYDNPYINRDEYRNTLMGVDPVVRAQMLEGNWDVIGGGATFNRTDFSILTVPPAECERIVRSWDTAATAPVAGVVNSKADWTVGALVGRTMSGVIVLLDMIRLQARPGGVEKAISDAALLDGEEVPIYMEQEPGAAGVIVIDHYATKVLSHRTFIAVRSTGNKAVRAVPFANEVAAQNVALLRAHWNRAFLDECEAFPYGSHDDQVDAVALAVNQLTTGSEVKEARTSVKGLFEWRG